MSRYHHSNELAARIRANDPTLTYLHLGMYVEKQTLDATDLCRSFAGNETITKVFVSSELLQSLSTFHRREVIRALDQLVNLENVNLSLTSSLRIGVEDLAALVQNTKKLRVLEMSSLVLEGYSHDFLAFCHALRFHPSLTDFKLSPGRS